MKRKVAKQFCDNFSWNNRDRLSCKASTFSYCPFNTASITVNIQSGTEQN